MSCPKMASILVPMPAKLKNMKTNADSVMTENTGTIHLIIQRWMAPICPLLLVTDKDGIVRAIEFADYESRMDRLLREHYGRSFTLEKGAAPLSLTRALQAYFEGNLEVLSEVQTA